MIEVIFLKVITNLLFNAETDIFIMIKKKPGKLTIITSPLSLESTEWRHQIDVAQNVSFIMIKPAEGGSFRSEAREAG